MFLAGCVTEYADYEQPMAAPPRDIPAQPANMTVNRIAFHPTLYARDTNGSGRGDTFDATVYLWSEPYPFPLHVDGTLTVSLYRPGDFGDPDTEPLREWVFSGETLRAAQSRALPGPCYYLQLSLLQPGIRGGDDLGLRSADLVAQFTANGQRVVTSGISTIHLDRPVQ